MYVDFFKFINQFHFLFLYETFLTENNFEAIGGNSMTMNSSGYQQSATIQEEEQVEAYKNNLVGIACEFVVESESTFLKFMFDNLAFRLTPVYLNCNHWERDFAQLQELVMSDDIQNSIIIGDLQE